MGGPATAEGGGGGGAGEQGDDYPAGSRNGGDGLFYPTASLCGASVGESGTGPLGTGFYFAGGGAGNAPTAGCTGGLGGGGCAALGPPSPDPAAKGQGDPNTGGGGAKRTNTGTNTQGGSGVVVIRYQFK